MEFCDSLKVGNTVMDHEHKNLVLFINVLQQSIESGATEEVVDEVLSGLTDYAGTHFLVEEELMKAYDYPYFGEHKRTHGHFIAKLEEFTGSFYQSREAMAEALLDFLMSWLINHILKIDAKLAVFLREKGMN